MLIPDPFPSPLLSPGKRKADAIAIVSKKRRKDASQKNKYNKEKDQKALMKIVSSRWRTLPPEGRNRFVPYSGVNNGLIYLCIRSWKR